MSDKVALDFTEISHRLWSIDLPDIDLVIGIATGGIVPASLIAHQLNKPLSLLHINFRNDDNLIKHSNPQLLSNDPLPESPQNILLVDDVSVTGSTLRVAKALLETHHVTTLVMKGQGDFVLFPEVPECVLWPWKMDV